MPVDPVIIYKEGNHKSIAAVDLAGWVADGWSTTIAAPKPVTTKVEIVAPAVPIKGPEEIKVKK